MNFCCELYRLQAEAGRYYLHEHQASAASWQLEEVQQLLRSDGAEQVVGDQCQYGQEIAESRPVKKPSRWLSNSPEILNELKTRCLGRAGDCSRPGGGSHAVTLARSRGRPLSAFSSCAVRSWEAAPGNFKRMGASDPASTECKASGTRRRPMSPAARSGTAVQRFWQRPTPRRAMWSAKPGVPTRSSRIL